MKRLIVWFGCALWAVCLSSVSLAETAKPQVKLDAQSIAKATELIRKNPELFKNPELLQRYMRLARTLNQKKAAR